MIDFGKNPDGTNRTFGQLSRDKQDAVVRRVTTKLKAELEHPAMQAQISRIFNSDLPQRSSERRQ